jgi:hypothetical protein
MAKNCRECQCALNAEEVTYYEDRCEDCERAWMARVDEWVSGGDDEQLDILYGVVDERSH